MKITMTPGHSTAIIDGEAYRIWDGVTDKGKECMIFVKALMVKQDGDEDEFWEEFGEPHPVNVTTVKPS